MLGSNLGYTGVVLGPLIAGVGLVVRGSGRDQEPGLGVGRSR